MNNQTPKKEKKNKGRLVRQLLLVTIVPLLVLSLAGAIFGIVAYRRALDNETEQELRHLGAFFWAEYDALYPGELSMKEERGGLVFYKGNDRIDKDFSKFDLLKETTGAEISLFYQDTRILTTLEGEDGSRLIGIGANQRIIQDVLQNGEQVFYPNTMIDGKAFLTWYQPITNKEGSPVGMLGLAIERTAIIRYFGRVAIPLALMAAAAVQLSIWISISYAGNLTKVLRALENFVQEVSKENLGTELPLSVLKRNDELGTVAVSVKNMQHSLKRLIETDQLTGLYNRRFAEKKFHQTYLEAENNGVPFCISIGDIDFFKKVNDTYGHGAGDQVLMDVSALLREGMRGHGYACRFGGEEFLLVFENESPESAEEILSGILDTIRAHTVLYTYQEIRVTMSFGLTEGYTALSESALLKEADERLYYAKENGRNRIIAVSPAEIESVEQ